MHLGEMAFSLKSRRLVRQWGYGPRPMLDVPVRICWTGGRLTRFWSDGLSV